MEFGDEMENVPLVWHNDGVLRDEISVIFVFFRAAMGNTERDDRLPAKELKHNSLSVGQRAAVRKSGEAVGADHAVDFCLGLALDFWVERHREEEGIDD